MNNKDLLKNILSSTDDYWCVERKAFHGPNEFLLISIPLDFKRGTPENEILFCDMEKLYYSEIKGNIFLSIDIPPFQVGIGMSEFIAGFPVPHNVNLFIAQSLNIGKFSYLHEYKKLCSSLTTEPVQAQ